MGRSLLPPRAPTLPEEPGPSIVRLAAVQPVSRGRRAVRFGISWLVVAALALTGCSTNIPLPLSGPLVTVEMRGALCAAGACDNSVIAWDNPLFVAVGVALGPWVPLPLT